MIDPFHPGSGEGIAIVVHCAHSHTTSEEGRGFAVILGIKRSRRQWGVLVSIPGKGTCAGHGTHLAPRSPPRFLVAGDFVAEEGETAERGGRGALTHLFHLFTVTHTTSLRKGPLLPLGFCAHRTPSTHGFPTRLMGEGKRSLEGLLIMTTDLFRGCLAWTNQRRRPRSICTSKPGRWGR